MSKRSENIKVLILDMQPIDPPVGGGRIRLLGLYHNLGNSIEANYIGTFDWKGESYRDHKLSDTLREIDVPLSDKHFDVNQDLYEKSGGVNFIDVLFSKYGVLSSDYINKVNEFIEDADIVIFSHPWVFPLVKHNLKMKSQLIVYDSQNVEGKLKYDLLDDNGGYGTDAVKEVLKAENSLSVLSDLILACSDEDKLGFNELYDIDESKVFIYPNGCFVEKLLPVSDVEKSKLREEKGLEKTKCIGIFIGSGYKPNKEAADFILDDLALRIPDMIFVIAGSVGDVIKQQKVGKNVIITGTLSEKEKNEWLNLSDIAINPMFSGSGTNIKMFDFMAVGLPIITTKVGARGITDKTTEGIIIADKDEMPGKLLEFINKSCNDDFGKLNRKFVETNFAWEKISPKLGDFLINKFNEKKENESIKLKNKKITIMHISTVGHRCGIGEYTLNMIKYLNKKNIRNIGITCKTGNFVPDIDNYDFELEVGWFHDNHTWKDSYFMVKPIKVAINENVDHVIIQYHPGYYSIELLLDIIKEFQQSSKLGITVLLHNVRATNLEILKKISECNVRLFCHSYSEQKFALENGITINFLPHGVHKDEKYFDKSIINRNWVEQPPIITTTGFIRQHKGIQNLIASLPFVHEVFPGARLIIQSSLFPSEDSKNEFNHSSDLINHLKLSDYIELNTSFIPIEEVYNSISRADVAVLPYDGSNEGGSGTVAICLTAGLPLILSNAEIFDEVRDYGVSLENNDPDTIADSIIKLLSSKKQYSHIVGLSNCYVMENSWEVVVDKILEGIAGDI